MSNARRWNRKHATAPKRETPKGTGGFSSLDIHVHALKRRCPRCDSPLYRDAWGDAPRQVKVHSCPMCGFVRVVSKVSPEERAAVESLMGPRREVLP